MQDEYEKALEGDTDLDKKLGELNMLAYKDLILCINASFTVQRAAFGLVSVLMKM